MRDRTFLTTKAMARLLFLVISAASLPALIGQPLAAGSPTLVLNDPAYPYFHASALDQPVLDVYLTDPQNGNQVFWDFDPTWEENVPVIYRAFVDTGASGFVLSHLIATGLYDVPSIYLTENDYIGTFTELGIGGSETGYVSRPFGVHVLNGTRQTGWEGNLDEFTGYGDFNLWVRQEEGVGEKLEIFGFIFPNPVNIIGMPVIRQGLMIMDASGLGGEELEYLATYLVPPGSPEPDHNLTLQLFLKDFVGEEPPPGEIFPSHTTNPMVPAVTVTHTAPGGQATSVTGQWLFDTGAGSSFVSFAHAQTIGLIPPHHTDLESFLVDHQAAGGNIATVGGIGKNLVTVPVLQIDEVRIPTKQGFDIAWQGVYVLIKEIEELAELGIDGIFGMNLLVPSVTLDGNDPENLDPLFDASPGVFRTIVFDATDEENVELRLFTFRLGNSFASWRESHFNPLQLDNPAISGPEADPDHDGIPNLLEYAFGGLPWVASRSNLPTTGTFELDDQIYLTLTYERIQPASDIQLIVEASKDLVIWTVEETQIIDSIDLGHRERVTVRATEPLDADTRDFLRLRVDLIEP